MGMKVFFVLLFYWGLCCAEPLHVYTANVLGAFSDPFEFAGDYGPEMNPTRDWVFRQVVPREALARWQDDPMALEQAAQQDRQHGPTLGELVTPDLLRALKKKDADGGEKIESFITKFQHQKIFRFLNQVPKGWLSLDKRLPDKAAQRGQDFSLPILGSMALLKGKNPNELKLNLMEDLYQSETYDLTRPQKSLGQFTEEQLKELLGRDAEIQDVEFFRTPSGQVFVYWLYQVLNLHLTAKKVEQVNQVKRLFAETLGDPKRRAELLKERLRKGNADLLFTQESDLYTREALVKGGEFLPVEQQNDQDGTFVFLRSAKWDPNPQVLTVEGYDGFEKGRLNLLLARLKSGPSFLLASAHGASTDASDGRRQVSLVYQKFQELVKEHPTLQLVMGMDANTKTPEEVADLEKHLEKLGLVGTSVGPTTVKQRMVTVQHSKVGKLSIDEEDYIITLQEQQGGRYIMTDPTVGFQSGPADSKQLLPDLNNPSDHYPVGVILKKIH